MQSLKRKIFFAVVVLLIVILVAVFVIALDIVRSSALHGHSYSGDHISYPVSSEVEEELKPYINITLTGMHGNNFMWYQSGRVSWIASPQDSVKSVENIHLLMYSRVNSTTTMGDSTWKVIEIRVVAYKDNFSLPLDLIDQSQELLIPQLGINNSQYEFELSCRIT